MFIGGIYVGRGKEFFRISQRSSRAASASGKPRPAIGKQRARKLKAALEVAESVLGPTPVFEGDSMAFLRAVMCGQDHPEPAQIWLLLLYG